MGSDNVAFAGATRIAADLARGAYSSRDIVDLFISRIERFDGDINAVVVRRFEEARREADAADKERAAARIRGRLHGVPMTIKECFDFTGLPSTYGHPELAGTRAAADAVTVARLRGAGAIVLGKTNVPLDLADWETHNEIYGHTRNPWDLGRSAGGSSGGSAAALAAGLCSLELGERHCRVDPHSGNLLWRVWPQANIRRSSHQRCEQPRSSLGCARYSGGRAAGTVCIRS